MKRLLWTCLLALPLLAVPRAAQAWYCCPPIKIDAGAKAWFNVTVLDPQGQPGPWYLYFPYDPHVQSPAPIGDYPFWPSNPGTAYAPSYPGRWGGPAAQPQAGFQPAGYYPAAPAYWYGR